ncbi:MAG: hypothetical protein JXA18_07680 [Chitinispirillaceae bacterium]|nr:hypothetical protein [Chitinispirillaceae bacterium]
MVNRTLVARLFIALWTWAFFVEAVTMKPIFNANGEETGSYNVNPDPEGEPWMVTPLEMTPDIRKQLDAIPEWEPRRTLGKVAASSLPSAVNHFKEPEFRPVFTQKGGACSAASGTGYVYTWEANILTGAEGTTNRCMYFYGYNFLNRGSAETGIWWYDAWNIFKYTGCVREADWPSPLGREQGTEWAATYAAYHNANFDRCSTYYKISKPGTPENIIKVKQWMFDHGRGDPKGGCVQLNSGVDFEEKVIPQGSAEAGSKIATVYDGPNTIHAMMLAGYNDDVYLDPNKKGAFLLVNSWGTSFGTKGTLWIPYDKFVTETEVYLMEVVTHVPRLEFSVTLKDYGKSGGGFTSGFAKGTDVSNPTSTQTYGKAFSGNTGTFTGEIGLDCSKFWQEYSQGGGTGTFFLQSKGSGTVAALSLMLYDETGRDLVKEIRCSKTNVSIGTTMSIVVENAVAVTEPLIVRRTDNITLRKLSRAGYELFIPFAGVSRVTIDDLQGREQTTFTSNGSAWHKLPKHLNTGIKIVRVGNGNKQLVEKINIVR